MKFQCLSPLVAASLGKNQEGKNILKFIPQRFDYCLSDLFAKYGQDNVFLLPCGSCESCRRNYADEWSIRCVCEAKMHEFNYFITLTYSDEFVESSCWKDFSRFLDRLEGFLHRNKFKYFACFEKGELTGRNHFHAILFMDEALTLRDATKLNGIWYYHADEITEKWKFGLHNIAPFTSECARYVAKYTNKGDCKGSIRMSNNLGKIYLISHLNEIIDDNFKIYDHQFEGGSSAMPQCFYKWMIDNDIAAAVESRNQRKLLGHLYEMYGLRNLGDKEHIESYIFSKQDRVKEHLSERRSRDL